MTLDNAASVRAASAVGDAPPAGGPQAPAGPDRRPPSRWRHDGLAYLLLLGPMAIMLVVLVVPAVFNIYASFFDWRLFGDAPRFVGIDNWVAAFAEPRWLGSLARTAVFVVATVGLQVGLGFAIAYLLYKHLGRMGVLSVVFLLPMMISEVAAALIWQLILSGRDGALNWLIGLVGIEPQQWLGPDLALYTVIAIDAWMNVPFAVLVMFAAMQAMPKETLEAAEVDGATGLKKLRHILIPLLQPAILVVLLFRTIFALRAFGTIFTLTGGGPGDRTAVIGIEVYRVGFANFNVGFSATLSLLMLIVSLIVSVGYIKWLTRESLT